MGPRQFRTRPSVTFLTLDSQTTVPSAPLRGTPRDYPFLPTSNFFVFVKLAETSFKFGSYPFEDQESFVSNRDSRALKTSTNSLQASVACRRATFVSQGDIIMPGAVWTGGFEYEDAQGYRIQFLPDIDNDKLQRAGKPPVYYWMPGQVRLARKNGTEDYKF